MYSNKLYTPLRYPGGKARFAPFVANVIRQNHLDGGHYLEPYAGGAGVALELLFDGIVEKIHINDVDAAVYDFWAAATQHAEDLIEMVETQPVTMQAWHHWRNIMLGEMPGNLVERGFATLFMNRTNRSGILKAGVIGGKNQSGEYKLDARFMRDKLIDRLRRIGLYADRINVYREDALYLLKRCCKFLPTKSLIYLDPPYYIKGQGLYRNYYEHDDHVAISKLIQGGRFARNWMVSYDNVEEICEMYSCARKIGYDLKYTAHRRYVGSEVLFLSSGLEVSEVGEFALAV